METMGSIASHRAFERAWSLYTRLHQSFNAAFVFVYRRVLRRQIAVAVGACGVMPRLVAR
jgi:hypothetical protein